jgi:3-deoxy-manno-octulosonate cytidylyltransferase (CMP-KDO synthetase)
MKWPKWKEVYVATDSKDIVEACAELGIPSIMTRDDHTDCLDRAAEVVEKLENEKRGAEKYIIIQGDEPLFNVETLDTDLSPSIVNFYTEVQDNRDLYDTNAVKVVVSKNNKALYFSRYSIPYHDEKTKRTDDEVTIYKQIGVYVFSGEMLSLYTNLESSSLENMEGIGLNRLLENDVDVHMRYTQHDSISVDVPDDRDRIISLIKAKNK